ncbi:MAG: ATP-binding cassette domain-containing protein, partial [Rhodospirillaceae bacterium]
MTDTASDAYLRVENLTKAFGDFTALADISLEVHEGEFVCFLGPSGCGKTTLLRAIAGLDIQSAGRVWQAGADISALPPSERDFGIVFQSYALFPNLSVKRNVAYADAQATYDRGRIQRDFGYTASGAVDPNNPYSRAALLEQSFA